MNGLLELLIVVITPNPAALMIPYPHNGQKHSLIPWPAPLTHPAHTPHLRQGCEQRPLQLLRRVLEQISHPIQQKDLCARESAGAMVTAGGWWGRHADECASSHHVTASDNALHAL
jgi:hypothetical protein